MDSISDQRFEGDGVVGKDFVELQGEIAAGMEELAGEATGVMSAFFTLHQAATADGEVPKRYKELIALAISIAIRCEGCIAFHVKDAVAAGATRGEVIETIGVAVLMGGGPSVVYGIEAREALDQFLVAST
jgi:AhpD family alkylhydroperoxidase